MHKSETGAQDTNQNPKKPYHKPEVIVYGNILDITKNIGTKGMMDGGGAAAPKTR